MADAKRVVDEQNVADPTAVEPAGVVTEAGGRRRAVAPPRALPPVTVRTVWVLALPVIVDQVLHAAIGLTDTIIAGHLPGTDDTRAAAAAAVGVMNYLQWFSGLMTSALGVGATAVVARSIGARRTRVANRVAGTALTGAFLVGLCVAIAMFVFAEQVARGAGLSGLATEYGVQYLRIMVITIALASAGQIGMASLRGAGDTVRPMFITAAVAVINILTATTFSFGLFGFPAWGIRGNAFGTMLAYLVGGAATLLVLLRGWGRLRLELRHFRIVPHELVRVLRIGLPSWLEGLLLWSGQFAIVILAINRNDAAIGVSGVTMAAHSAVLRIESLAFLPGFGFGIAASTLVGQYLGARLADHARRAAFVSLGLALATMTLAALPMVFMPRMLLGIIVDSEHVVRIGVWPMILAGLVQPMFAVAIIMSRALQGAGETVWPMVSTMLGMFAIRLPVLLVLLEVFHRWGKADWGLLAVWIGIFVDLNLRAVVNTAVFLRGKWRYKRV